MTRAFAAAAVACMVAALAAAGCVRPPQEAGHEQPPCELDYVTTQWTNTGEADELRPELEAAGYTWLDRPMEGVAELLTPDPQVTGVVSHRPGVSGEDLVMSFEETSPALEGDVRLVARNAADVVNATFPNATLANWIEGTHTTACGPLIEDGT